MNIKPGSTDVSVPMAFVNKTTGLAATGLTITDIDLQYTRIGSTPAAKVDATALAATNTAHTDNNAIELDATDQPGAYRVDWPDAAFASSAAMVLLTALHADCHPAHVWISLEGANVTHVNGGVINGTGTPNVNVTQISGSTTAADNLEVWFDTDKPFIRLVVSAVTDADTFVVTTAVDTPTGTFDDMQATLIRKSVSNATPERKRCSTYTRTGATTGSVQLADGYTSVPAVNDVIIFQ